MPLRDLLNNDPTFPYYYGGQGNFSQKSIPWGKDSLGGGDSGQPFIKWPINGERASITNDPLQEVISINRSSRDYPIRGGNNQTISTYGTPIPAMAAVDYLRIKRFLDSPNGRLFIDKQVGLQVSNPLTETGTQINLNNSFNRGRSIFDNIASTRFLGELEATRIFNRGRNLLSQVSVGGSGIHMDRHGVVPFNSPETLYSNIVPFKPADQNRLVLLYQSKIVRNNLSIDNISNLSRLGISNARNYLFDYIGGPKSFYGIGSTLIRRFVDTTQELPIRGYENGTVSPHNFKALNSVFTQTQLANAKQWVKESGSAGEPFDFRTKLANVGYGDYSTFNLEIKKGLGIPGLPKTNYNDYTSININSQDKLNLLTAFWVYENEDPWSKEQTSGNTSKDIIKFGFESIDNDNPNSQIAILFRAYLDSFSDNHNASWQSFKYIGRGDDFYTYQGFSREISFAFKIAAQTREEMKPLYKKLNILASQIYPDYSSKEGYMRAPLIKMTLGDYIYRQPGFLKSINIVIDKEFPWEIKMDDLEKDINMAQLPQILSINCTFVPIHNFLPEKDKIKYDNTQLIGEKFGSDLILLQLDQL